MATWLILVLAALVLAVLGATTAATWLLVLGVVVLVIGVVWAIMGRTTRGGSTTTPCTDVARRRSVMVDTTDVAQAARSASDSKPLGWLARLGLTARGIVYLLMGWLAILLATGSSTHVDQRGVLIEVLSAPFGTFLVLLMALAFLAYAVWRFSEAAFGVTGEGRGAGPRLKALARGLVYLVLAFTSLQILSGRAVRRPTSRDTWREA